MSRFLRGAAAVFALWTSFCGQVTAALPIAVEQDAESAIARRIFFRPQLRPLPGDAARSSVSRREIADRLIAEHRGLLFGGEPIELEHLRTRNSLSGSQVFYRQLHGGVPVEQSEFVVSLDRAAAPLSIRNQASPGLHLRQLRPSIAPATAIASVDRSEPDNIREAGTAELVVLPREGGRLAYRVEISLWSPFVDWLAYVDAHSGEVLERVDRVVHEKPVPEGYSVTPFEIPAPSGLQPSANKVIGSGLVLPINPLNGHPERYHLRDGDPVIDTFRESKPLEHLDGSGFLRGSFADVVNPDMPSRAKELSHVFEYSSLIDNSPFHEVNTYWHVDMFQSYISFTLGISGANDEQQLIAVHGTELDNSSYTPGSDLIDLGDGGVDDSEDGEVIIHEYGHAVHDAISGLSAFSTENRALSEGFGDYLAATMGDNPYVMEWDATSYFEFIPQPWPMLRRLDTGLRYENRTGSIHDDGRIIGGAWWDLRQVIGAALADQLVLESFFLFSQNGDFQDFADAMQQVDIALYGGAHLVDIFEAYDLHGIAMTSLLAGDHAVPADSDDGVGPFPVTLSVASTRPLAASSPVQVHFRYNDGGSFVPVDMGPAGGNDWNANLPGPNARKRIEYYFEFENDLGMSARLPADAPTSFYSFGVGGSLAASGIQHAGLPDLALESWPPTLSASLLGATADQRLFVRYEIGASPRAEVEMLDRGDGIFSATLPNAPVEAGAMVRYELVAPTEVGELVDGPHSFKILAPSRLLLRQNAPNPFNPSTTISFLLPQSGRARLVIYDVAGRQVRELLNEDLAAGAHARSWDGRDDGGRGVASGVYLYRLQTPSGVRAKRMTLTQ